MINSDPHVMEMKTAVYTKELHGLFKQWEDHPCAFCGLVIGLCTKLHFLSDRRACKCCLQHYIDRKPGKAPEWADPQTCPCKAHCLTTGRQFFAKPQNRSDRRQRLLAQKKEMKRQAKQAGLHLTKNGP